MVCVVSVAVGGGKLQRRSSGVGVQAHVHRLLVHVGAVDMQARDSLLLKALTAHALLLKSPPRLTPKSSPHPSAAGPLNLPRAAHAAAGMRFEHGRPGGDTSHEQARGNTWPQVRKAFAALPAESMLAMRRVRVLVALVQEEEACPKVPAEFRSEAKTGRTGAGSRGGGKLCVAYASVSPLLLKLDKAVSAATDHHHHYHASDPHVHTHAHVEAVCLAGEETRWGRLAGTVQEAAEGKREANEAQGAERGRACEVEVDLDCDAIVASAAGWSPPPPPHLPPNPR